MARYTSDKLQSTHNLHDIRLHQSSQALRPCQATVTTSATALVMSKRNADRTTGMRAQNFWTNLKTDFRLVQNVCGKIFAARSFRKNALEIVFSMALSNIATRFRKYVLTTTFDSQHGPNFGRITGPFRR